MFEARLWTLIRVFRCRHARMGQPITLAGETYRACVACGARRLFDTEKWDCYGRYFYEKSPAAAVRAGQGRRTAARAAAVLEPRQAGCSGAPLNAGL